jgi:sec-independent protein translocase protein TatC
MQSVLPHLIELRHRLLKSVVCIVSLFVPLFFYANTLFGFLARPLVKHLHGKMIAVNVTAPLLVPIELAAKVAFLLSMPYLLYQIWYFISPALFKRERGYLGKLLFTSVCLFYLGVAFCYWVVLPLMFSFLTSTVPANVALMPDISYYLSITSRFFILFGFAFEVPVVVFFLVASELVTVSSLEKGRPYLIVGAFIIGMLLTPPDVLSQVLLALPLCLLYELGIFVAKKWQPQVHTPEA